MAEEIKKTTNEAEKRQNLMSKFAKLAIVIIGHNDMAHLSRAITSAAGQSADFDSVRVIYADDASTDGSADFVEYLKTKFSNIEVFRSPINRNIGGIRNAAVEYINQCTDKPEYIWFHDSDDFLPAGAVKLVLDTLNANPNVDAVSVPVYTMRDTTAPYPDCTVRFTDIAQAAAGPVGEWSIVFKRELYVQNPEGQACEDCPWHFEQFDKFETWAKVEGAAPCYVWDNTNPAATTRTVDYCATHSITLISAALDNVLIRDGKNDKWISDNLRNLANMYDVRRRLTKPHVFAAWRARFQTEVSNFLNGFHIH